MLRNEKLFGFLSLDSGQKMFKKILKLLFINLLIFMNSSIFSKKLSSEIKISVDKYKLDNGMTVLLNPDKKLKTVSYFLGYRVGSRYEKKGITGISHMFEHLMFRGTKKYPDFNKTYGLAGVTRVNAFTSRDMTAYLGAFAPEQMELILDVESDRMTNLVLNQELLDKERGAVQEERKMIIDNNPMGYLFEELMLLTFQEHPYRWHMIGIEEDIANYTLEDLQNWYQTYYSPNNAVLVISGGFDSKETRELIEKYFAGIPPKKIPEENSPMEPEQTKARQKALTKKVQSAAVLFAYVGPPSGTKESYALNFLVQVLGAGESSVLYKKIVREQKLLPSISIDSYDLHKNQVIYASYPLIHLDKEEKIKQRVLAEIQKALETSLTPDSVEKAKNITMNEMVSMLKSSYDRADLLLNSEIAFNDYQKIYDQIDFLNEIDFDFVSSVGKKYLKEDRLNYITLKPEK